MRLRYLSRLCSAGVVALLAIPLLSCGGCASHEDRILAELLRTEVPEYDSSSTAASIEPPRLVSLDASPGSVPTGAAPLPVAASSAGPAAAAATDSSPRPAATSSQPAGPTPLPPAVRTSAGEPGGVPPPPPPNRARPPDATASLPASRDAVSPQPPPRSRPPDPAEPKASASGAMVIQPECILSITVAEDSTLNGNYRVNDFSAIEFGRFGLVIMHNMTEEEAARRIKELLESRDFKVATVTLRIAKASYDKIRVVGEVERPGDLKIAAGLTTTLNEALLRCGGVRIAAEDARVRIIRGGMLSPIGRDFAGEEYAMSSDRDGPRVPEVELRSNDLIYIWNGRAGPAGSGSPKFILVLGESRKQGLVWFAPNEPCTMMYLTFKLDGFPKFAKTNAIRIVRRGDDGVRKEFVISIDRVMRTGAPEDDTPLENGDTVIVPARTFALF